MALLTDTKARHIKPNDKPISHGGVTGLTLHPSSTKGRGKWVLRYVSPVTQKRRNAGLGSYPEVSIAEAAKLAQTMREQLFRLLKRLHEKFILSCFQDGVTKSMPGSGYLHSNSMCFQLWGPFLLMRLHLPMLRMFCVLRG